MTQLRSRFLSVGSYLPSKCVTNTDLMKTVDTTDAWIIERTGIQQRYIAADDEFTSDLATAAARQALTRAGLAPADIDVIIVATATPDQTFPATATRVQANLGMTHGFAFDVQAVCSGFVYALSVADGLLQSGQAKTALVIGAETFSRILDWEDRTTCVLFGDGAGAVVLRAEPVRDDKTSPGIIASRLRSDGRYNELLYVDGGPSSTRTVGHLRMKGPEVFRHAVTNLAGVTREVLALASMSAGDVDWIVPHQANRRILEGTATKLGLPLDRLIITVHKHANTSAASVPLALETAVSDGRIQPGNVVLFEAMGGGFTWGASLARW
jgi:3-oxoacyl-[acyl-carrier-protein] synthase III